MKKEVIITFLVLVFVAALIALVGLLVNEGFWCVPGKNYSNSKIGNYFCSIMREKTAVANKAAINCLNKGGELISKKDKQGDYNTCRVAGDAECEIWAYLNNECLPGLSLEYSKNSETIAKNWITYNSPTFLFDGYNLTLKEITSGRCTYCFELTYSFSSRNSGYGDRTGKSNDKKQTNHAISVIIENGKIVSALTDGRFNEMESNTIGQSKYEEIFSNATEIKIFGVENKNTIGRAQYTLVNNKSYYRIIAEKLPMLQAEKKYAVWLIKTSDDSQFFSLGKLNYNIDAKYYQLDFVIDGSKADYDRMVITEQANDKIIRPETRLAEGVFPHSEK